MKFFRELILFGFFFSLPGCQILGKKSSQAASSAEELPVRGIAALSPSVSQADRDAFDEAVAAIKTGNMQKLTDSLPPYPEGSIAMLRFLNLRNTAHGSALLHIAMFEKNLPAVKAIVEKAGGESLVLNAVNFYGDIPIHMAVRTDNLPIVNFFLEQTKVNVNGRNNEGNTPLHLSCMRNKPLQIIKTLAAKGARPEIGNNKNISPISFCEYYQGEDSAPAKYLKRHFENRQKKIKVGRF